MLMMGKACRIHEIAANQVGALGSAGLCRSMRRFPPCTVADQRKAIFLLASSVQPSIVKLPTGTSTMVMPHWLLVSEANAVADIRVDSRSNRASRIRRSIVCFLCVQADKVANGK